MLSVIFRKQHPKVGARPGTLVISERAEKPKVRMVKYSPDDMQQNDVEDVSLLEEALEDDSVTWIDVQGLGNRELFHQIGEIFDLHPLLLEDIVNVPQRPKTESYDDQLLVIVRMVRLDDEQQADMEQVSVVIGKSYVLTFQERYGDVLDPVRERIQIPTSRLRNNGSDYLAYALIDTIVDAYYPVLENVGDHLESLEDVVIENPTPELLSKLNRLKSRLVNLRRGIWPQREAIGSLARDEYSLITDDVRIFLRDTYDHCVQTTEVTEMYREMVTGLMNTYLSSIANRTNEVMKVLTLVATIFIPLTFLAGIYGMNFDYMPELHVRWAYPAIWLAMLGTAIFMVSFFRRRGWL